MTDLTGAEIGRYHIIEPLGQGGMAAVYKALDTTLEREVALKVIRVEEFAPAVLEKVLQRFEREAKTLARLTHSHIVPIIDYGQHNGVPYLVMPYFRGGTLRERLGRPLEEGEAARLLLPLADALGYAHRKGVLHRDIKPANILLNEEGQPMLTDFGIAKLLDAREGQTLTGTGVGIGTPEYMSPEQGMGKEVDARADIYALGVVLFELVTGQKPYSADTPMAVVVQHLHDPLPRPRDLNPGVSEACEQVLFKALAKQPEHRYADMEAFRAALAGLAAGERAVQPPAAPLAMDMPAAEQTTELTAAGLTVELGTGLRPPEAPRVEVPAPATRRVEPEPGEKIGQTNPPVPPHNTRRRWMDWRWILPGLAGVLAILYILAIVLGLINNPLGRQNTQAADAPACAEIGQRWVNPVDGGEMVCVPAGEFWMGAAEDDTQAYLNEKPGRMVHLNAYWIDRYEVTNAQYANCVSAGGCSSPASYSSSTRVSYYGNSTYADYPMVVVDWNQAKDYCEWTGEGLPTEAQWEKAARGTDGRLYPWGNQYPDGNLVNFNDDEGDTSAAGSFPGGDSPYGAGDMAGNVWEWTADWYDEDYYQGAPSNNPAGPVRGKERVLRGGVWYLDVRYLRVTYRIWDSPAKARVDVGFRCVLSSR